MRMQSAASAKGKSTFFRNLLPREGSELRRLNEQFIAEMRHVQDGIVRLVDFYGLDIRPFDRHKPRKYWLVGEWFGSTYLDYVADRRAQEEREAR